MTSAILLSVMPEKYAATKQPSDWMAHFIVCCDKKDYPIVHEALGKYYKEFMAAVDELPYFDASVLLGQLLSRMTGANVVVSPVLEMGYVYQTITPKN